MCIGNVQTGNGQPTGAGTSPDLSGTGGRE